MKKILLTISLIVLVSSVLFFFGPSISIVSRVHPGDISISKAAKLEESKADNKNIDKGIHHPFHHPCKRQKSGTPDGMENCKRPSMEYSVAVRGWLCPGQWL